MRSKMLWLTVLSLTTLAAWAAIAQTPPGAGASAAPAASRPASLAEARRAVDAVMQKIGNDEMAGAFELLREQIALPEEEFKRLHSAAIKMRAEAGERLGKLVGVQFIRQEVVEDVMVRFTYVQKFERSLFVWHFYFYRPTDRWMLHGFNWSPKPEVLFDTEM